MPEIFQLQNRRPRHIIPNYSLTGDILSFKTCPLRYRYERKGQIPLVKSFQLWFGNYIHYVLEEAFRRFQSKTFISKSQQEALKKGDFVWVDDEIEDISNNVRDRLRSESQGLYLDNILELSIKRAREILKTIGPSLFPIIKLAEVTLQSTRPLTKPARSGIDKYILRGRVDIITHKTIANEKLGKKNIVIKSIKDTLPLSSLPAEYEIIVDYKGMRRPADRDLSGNLNSKLEYHKWQVQTYAHLRSLIPDSLPVVAGILLYVNELYPSRNDLKLLKKEISNRQTDLGPTLRENTDKLRLWTKKQNPPEFSLDLRLSRTIMVVPIDDKKIKEALDNIDKDVTVIEKKISAETHTGCIKKNWMPESDQIIDLNTCAECNFKAMCDHQNPTEGGTSATHPVVRIPSPFRIAKE